MKKNECTQKAYLCPEIKIFTIESENGFALSSVDGINDLGYELYDNWD